MVDSTVATSFPHADVGSEGGRKRSWCGGEEVKEEKRLRWRQLDQHRRRKGKVVGDPGGGGGGKGGRRKEREGGGKGRGKNSSPMRIRTPTRNPSPTRSPTSTRNPTFTRNPSPTRSPTPTRDPTSTRYPSPMRSSTLARNPNPTRIVHEPLKYDRPMTRARMRKFKDSLGVFLKQELKLGLEI
ncbi:serine/arginine-rich splicing factor RSZ22-like [Ricinus communis]|uniref:serine/arginine-rich splicing factor RSZ22-like n=1 Tax=Ricinus communis TaxID=3988 RepID=UPI00201A6EC9|nr:serine/arginine-rich splicing factor RSZ22-like [Ricinus communis]